PSTRTPPRSQPYAATNESEGEAGQRAQRKLRPRTDGTPHPEREWGILPARRNRSCEGLYGMDDGAAPERRLFPLRTEDARARRQDRPRGQDQRRWREGRP